MIKWKKQVWKEEVKELFGSIDQHEQTLIEREQREIEWAKWKKEEEEKQLNLFFIEKPKKVTKKKKTSAAPFGNQKPAGKDKVKGSAMSKKQSTNGLL